MVFLASLSHVNGDGRRVTAGRDEADETGWGEWGNGAEMQAQERGEHTTILADFWGIQGEGWMMDWKVAGWWDGWRCLDGLERLT